MKKLLYILPEYAPDAHTHFSYLPGFIDEIGKSLGITLIALSGRPQRPSGVSRIMYVSHMPILREISLAFSILRARANGCRTCYVHYSFSAAFLASLIFRASGGTVFYWNCGLPWQYPRPFFRDTFERIVYRLVSCVVTGTLGLADLYARAYGIPRAKILVMPNWIDVRKVESEERRAKREEMHKELGVGIEKKMVLFVHRLSERKGAQYLPAIAKGLPDNVILVVAGDGPLKESLQSTVHSQQLEEKIRFLGWVPHEKILSYMNATDVFIMPSDEEGFPHVLLEAMALGIPFVATDVGGVREIVPDVALPFIVPRGDMDRFGNALNSALTLSPEVRDAYGAVTRAWVRRFDSGVAVSRFLAIVSR